MSEPKKDPQSIEETMKANKEKQERLKKERQKQNQQVLKDYQIIKR